MISLVERIRQHSHPMEPLPTGAEAKIDPLSGIRCVLFDVYGTLIISGVGDIGLAKQSDRKQSIQETFAALEIPLSNQAAPEQLEADFVDAVQHEQGTRRAVGIEYPEVDIRSVWKRCCEQWQTRGWLKAIPERAMIEHISVEYECRVNAVWPMPGMADCLDWLTQEGIKLGIVSNAQFFTPLIFEACTSKTVDDLQFQRDLSVWSYEKLEAKPSTRLYEQAAQVLLDTYTIPPEAVLYIGNDRRNDIWPSAQVGFKTALFAGDKRSLRIRPDDPNLQNVTPDRVITHLSQLKSIIQSA